MATATADGVDLLGRYRILLNQPLAAFNTPGADAYAARITGGRNKGSNAIAFVLTTNMPPRTDLGPSMRAADPAGLMQAYEWGPIEWPQTGGRRMAFIYERPQGRRLFRAMKDQREPMNEDIIVRSVMTPFSQFMRYVSGRNLCHSKVRPTNMYWRDAASSEVILGECLCTPPGYGQPIMFETIERSMCTPTGRGNGSTTDDLYAFGVSLLMLIFGRNPVGHLRDDQILQLKMERGSYPALVGDLRVPLNLIEPLRGLLIDDPKQRWTLDEFEMWLSGRRLSPKQAQVPRRAGRPFELAGKVCWDLRSLALAMTRNVQQAAVHLESGDIDRWLRRSMSDDDKAEVVETAIESATSTGRGSSTEDRIVARVAIALDPAAPIRFQNLGTMPDAVGTLLAQLMTEQKSVQPVAELLNAQLGMYWLSMQTEGKLDYAPIVHTFEQSRVYLDKPQPGLGIERVLYDLNPSIPCISPLVEDYYCLEPQDLLRALDNLAQTEDRPKEPFDRHIAAFLMARTKRLDDRTMALIASGDPSRRYLAMLAVLADVQARNGPESLPNLATWMSELLDPILSRYRNAYFREELKREAQRIAAKGDLRRVNALIDDPKALARDEAGFEMAQKDFGNVSTEIGQLRYEIEEDPSSSMDLGRQAAAVVSSILAMSCVLLVAFVMVL